MSEPKPLEMSEELTQHCWDRRQLLMDKARLSALYHLRFESRLDRADKWLNTLTAVAATFGVGILLKKAGEPWELGASIVTAVLAIISIVWTPGALARRHSRLAAANRAALVEGERAGEHWTAQTCDAIAARLAEIEIEEGHLRPVVIALCENQLAMLRSSADERIKPIVLRWYERWFGYWIDFDAEAIRRRSERSSS